VANFVIEFVEPRFRGNPPALVVALRIKTMNAPKSIALAAAVAFSSTVSSAQTLSDCHLQAIPIQLTNFVRTASLPRFDPALGQLVAVELQVTANIRGTARVESLDAAPSVVNTRFGVDITVSQSAMPIAILMVPVADFSDALLAFDGILDSAGTSGVTHADIQASDQIFTVVPPTASNLALFTGQGMIDFVADARANSTASGAGNLFTQFDTSAGVDMRVCYTFIGNSPPTVSCPGNLMASVGVPLQFQVCATDPDGADSVTLNGVLPAGATANPPFPVIGNPACTTITWTPASNQVGSFNFTFTANDASGSPVTCTTVVGSAECHFIFGTAGGGGSNVTLFGHLYDSQLAGIRLSFPVTMVDQPTFLLRQLPPTATMQVLMYNPLMFPSNASQWSQALTIHRTGDYLLHSTYSGTSNGIDVRVETFQQDGRTRVRFPFTIAGM